MIFLPALHMAACASFQVLLLVSLLFGSGLTGGSLILAAVGPGVPSLRQMMPGPRAGGLGGRRRAARWSERLTVMGAPTLRPRPAHPSSEGASGLGTRACDFTSQEAESTLPRQEGCSKFSGGAWFLTRFPFRN